MLKFTYRNTNYFYIDLCILALAFAMPGAYRDRPEGDNPNAARSGAYPVLTKQEQWSANVYPQRHRDAQQNGRMPCAIAMHRARSGVPLEDLSRSIQVYDAPLIEEIRPWGVEDIVGLAANATFGGPGDGRGHQFSVRGFSAPIMRDGFTNANFGGVMNPETWAMQRVEVLKGPDSIQYGESDPGGLINFVSKRAQFEPEHRVQLQGASFGVVEPRVDLTGPVGDSARVAYRVLALAD